MNILGSAIYNYKNYKINVTSTQSLVLKGTLINDGTPRPLLKKTQVQNVYIAFA